MRFLTLDNCSDGELHCLYHDPERTVTLLHPRTACSLQVYAPEEDHNATFGTFHTRRLNDTHSWWLQLLGITTSQVLGIANTLVQYAVSVVIPPQPAEPVGPPVDRKLIRHHLINLRSVLPHYETLDEEEHIQNVQPLPSPWSFPSNAYYREARRGYLQYLSEPLIAELVTLSLLLVNKVGIRWKHMDQYILIKNEESVFNRSNRPRLEKLDAPAYRHKRITQPNINDEPNGMEEKRPGTPIIDVDSSQLVVGGKRVRLCSKKTCVHIGEKVTVVEVEDLEDNEGKTADTHRRIEAGRVKMHEMRSRICWDSDRGF